MAMERLDVIIEKLARMSGQIEAMERRAEHIEALAKESRDRLDATDARAAEFWRTTYTELHAGMTLAKLTAETLENTAARLMKVEERVTDLERATPPSEDAKKVAAIGGAGGVGGGVGGAILIWAIQYLFGGGK